MLKFKLKLKQAITVCVDKKYNIEVQRVIDHQIKTEEQHIYLKDDKVYVGFKTKSTPEQVAKKIKEILNTNTTIVGGMVFVEGLS